MKRPLYVLLLLSLVGPACKTAGPKAPPAPLAPPPELLRPYEGALRVLLHKGDVPSVALRAGESPVGACDVAVRVRTVAWEEGAARFALETVGEPRVGRRGARCKKISPTVQLAVTGFPTGPVTPEVTARIDEVLPTPEAYLRANGTSFDLPPGAAPSPVASQLSDANDDERKQALRVVAWPHLLLSVDAARPAPPKGARFERLVGVQGVVGTDGRLHDPKVETSLDRANEAAVLSALAFWRFDPARRADGPVGARIAQELVLRVY